MPGQPGMLRGQRRNRTEGRLVLPASCTLPAPELPPGRAWSDAERERWQVLWSAPQANAWDDSTAGTVALLIVAETALLNGSGSAWLSKQAADTADALGLTPMAMMKLGWTIDVSGGAQ